FNNTATTEIYTLSLHDALPISPAVLLRPLSDTEPQCPARFPGEPFGVPDLRGHAGVLDRRTPPCHGRKRAAVSRPLRRARFPLRSEEHTSELQSRGHLVCRLLL